jgi:hypothetical protein
MKIEINEHACDAALFLAIALVVAAVFLSVSISNYSENKYVNNTNKTTTVCPHCGKVITNQKQKEN